MLGVERKARERSSDQVDLLAFDDFTSQLNNGEAPYCTLEAPLSREAIISLPAPSLHGFVYELSLGMRLKRELRFFKTKTNDGIYPSLCVFTKDDKNEVMENYFFVTVRKTKRLANYDIRERGIEIPMPGLTTPVAIESFFKVFDLATFRTNTRRLDYQCLLRSFLDDRAKHLPTRLSFKMFADYAVGRASWLDWRDFVCWCRDKNELVEQERRSMMFS